VRRPRANASVAESADDRRIRDYVVAPGGMSESAASLADKLGVSRGRCRRVLEDLVRQGVLRRDDYSSIAPMYCRFPTLARPPASSDEAYTGDGGQASESDTAGTFAAAQVAGMDIEQTQGALSSAQ
jgi:hypothetical protein